MNISVRIKLSLLIFLEYFIWASWYVTMGTFLSYSLHSGGREIGLAYGAMSLGAIASPFLVGRLADRFMPPGRLLGILHLLGAALLAAIAYTASFDRFYPLLLAYTISYMPTISLSNTVCFRQMSSPEKDFSAIRVFGTIGWISAGLALGNMGWEKSHLSFLLASGGAALLGVFCFFLPKEQVSQRFDKSNSTPASTRLFGPEVVRLFTDRSFVIFFVSSILICIPLAFYYNFTNLYLNKLGISNAASIMSLGQASEFVFLLALPVFFRKAGIKVMLIIAMLAWVIRFVLFAYGNAGQGMALLYAGIILHGVCFDFFFVSGQIYTDSKAGEAVKNSAQGLITLATYGLGMLIGSWIGGEVSTHFSQGEIFNWKGIWLVPAAIAFFTLILFTLFFKDKSKTLQIQHS